MNSKHNHDGDGYLMYCRRCKQNHTIVDARPEGCGHGYPRATQRADGWWYSHLLSLRDGHECYSCKGTCTRGDEGSRLEVQHILPQSQGGVNCLHNLILLCHRCHANLAKNRRYGGIPGVTPGTMHRLEDFIERS